VEVTGQLHTLAILPPGKNFLTHLIGGWVGPRTSLDTFGKERKSHGSAGIQTPAVPVHSLVAVVTMLSWLELLIYINTYNICLYIIKYLNLYVYSEAKCKNLFLLCSKRRSFQLLVLWFCIPFQHNGL
jgi:hypothetical protein